MSNCNDVRTYTVDMGDKYSPGPVFEVVVRWDGAKPYTESVVMSDSGCNMIPRFTWDDPCPMSTWEMYDYLNEETIKEIRTKIETLRAAELQEEAESRENDPIEIANRKDDEAYHRQVDEELVNE